MISSRTRTIGMVAVLSYIATVFLANWAIETYGLVSVGFGLAAPAGVYFAGLAFTLRDITQDTLGRRFVVVAILIGAAFSAIVSTDFAIASATAFLFSELFDFAVYTPLRERNWLGAVAASNVVGLIADSVLFLWIAFGSLAFLEGQIIGKLWMTVAAVAVLTVWRRWSRDFLFT
ncbi:MAG: VUT family protein [Chloroflexota bacterium]|nr:VUT family protein [Chloroflexota bacterium]